MSLPATIRTWLSNDQTKHRFNEALMGKLPGDAFVEQCIMAAKDPRLSRCSPDSLLTAFLECAQLGLLPGPHKLVALVDRKGQVDVMVTARGFRVLLERVPGVKRLKAVLVHREDVFKRTGGGVDGTDPVHEWDPFLEGREFNKADDLQGGYLEATFDDGSKDWHYVSKAEIEAARKCARSQNVWQKWYGPMALKTIYRNAWARMFLPCDMASHAAAIDRAEGLERRHHREDPNYDADATYYTTVMPASGALTYEETTPSDYEPASSPLADESSGVVDAADS